MPSTPTILDPTRCPLCGRANQCAMELERTSGVKHPPCWCTQREFDRELLEQLPAEVRGKSCICPACARATG